MHDILLTDKEFYKFSRYVYEVCGINLHEGKKELLKARLGKILRKRNFSSFNQYYEHVVNDTSGEELINLLNSVSTNLTYFFREPQHFEFLRKVALREIIERKKSNTRKDIRIWCAGCSSGEEPYSTAVTLNEALVNDFREGNWEVKILATDLSTKELAAASAGIYKEEKLKTIPYDLKRRYFQRGENRWNGYFRVKKEIRGVISFQRLNFKDDFEFNVPFDVVFCRNVMIYFDKPTQQILVQKFYRNIANGGYLFIGHAESLTGTTHKFTYIQPSIFKKVAKANE